MLRTIALLASLLLATVARADYPLKGDYDPAIISYKDLKLPEGKVIRGPFIQVNFTITNDTDEVGELSEVRWVARPRHERVWRGKITYSPTLVIQPRSSVKTTIYMERIGDLIRRDEADARVYFIGKLTPPSEAPYRAGMRFDIWAKTEQNPPRDLLWETRYDFLKIGDTVTFRHGQNVCPAVNVRDFHTDRRGDRVGVRVEGCYDMVGEINEFDDNRSPIHDGTPVPWLYRAPYRATGCEVGGLFCVGDAVEILEFKWEPMEYLNSYTLLGTQPNYGRYYKFLLRSPSGYIDDYLHNDGRSPVPISSVIGKRQGCMESEGTNFCVGDQIKTTLVCKTKESTRTWHFDAKVETVNDGKSGIGPTVTVSYACPHDAKKTCYNAAEPSGNLIVKWMDCER